MLDADLPGFDREDIHLELQGDVLTITAQHQDKKEEKDEKGNYICRERTSNSYSRSFNVSGIRGEDITAAYENGVLQLTLPKQEAQVPRPAESKSSNLTGTARLPSLSPTLTHSHKILF